MVGARRLHHSYDGQEDAYMKWKRKLMDPGCSDFDHRYILTAEKLMAGSVLCDSAIEIEAVMNYNGSGPKHFGGVSKWPVARLKVAFTSESYADRDRFIRELKSFVERYFKTETEMTREVEAAENVG